MALLMTTYGPAPVLPIKATVAPISATGTLTMNANSCYKLTAIGTGVTIGGQYVSAATTANYNMANGESVWVHTQNGATKIPVTISGGSILQVMELDIS